MTDYSDKAGKFVSVVHNPLNSGMGELSAQTLAEHRMVFVNSRSAFRREGADGEVAEW